MKNQRVHKQFRVALSAVGTTLFLAAALTGSPAQAQPEAAQAQPEVAAQAQPEAAAKARSEAAPAQLEVATDSDDRTRPAFRLGAYAELDLGILLAMKQGAAFAGGAVWGPFRAGLSYATFLSNPSFGGVPKGFSMRANYILGLNASYFIGQRTDEGFYVQAMFHIKQQGVTNDSTGDHENLNSLATGLELGYVWKLYRGLYIAPRVGALYYLKSPQGSDNKPVRIGDRSYDNSRHKTFDTYYIPTLSVGYSW